MVEGARLKSGYTLGLKAALAAAIEEEQAQNRLQGILKATGYLIWRPYYGA